MHVVIVSEELPYPPNSGFRIRTFQLVSRLASRHRITFVCHRNADLGELRQAEVVFHNLGINTVVVDRSLRSKKGPVFYGRLAANLASSLPYSVQSHLSAELHKALLDLWAAGDVDLWHAEWTPLAQAFQIFGARPQLIMAHNVESEVWRRYYENDANPLRRWYVRHQWRKMKRFEQRALRQADRVVAVSARDAASILTGFGVGHVNVVENGVDTTYFQAHRPGGDSHQILFVGSLDWRPNLDAIDQLLSYVFPAVRAEVPSARLCLVGRNPPKWLSRRSQAVPGVELHANVPDVRPFLNSSAVMAIPLRIAGGSRLKILEAFAAGLPVVSSRIGAEGLRVRNGEHLAIVQRS